MVDNFAEVSSSTRFNWRIENFSKLNAQVGISSDVFSVGCFKWKAIMYPKGLGDSHDHISFYLASLGLTKSVYTEFSYAVINQTDPNNTVNKELRKEFPGKAFHSVGWSKFMSLAELHDPHKGYLVNDTCIISVEVTCMTNKNSKTGKTEKQTNQGYNDMMLFDFQMSTKYNWTIENFSKLNCPVGHGSDIFSVASFKWKAQIYPEGCNQVDDHFSLYLRPVELSKTVDTEFSLEVTSQTDPSVGVRREGKYKFSEENCRGWGWSKFMGLSELNDPDKGYIVNDTCVITVEVTCMMNKETKDDDDVNEGSPKEVEKTENEKQTNVKDHKRNPESVAYPGAGQLFGEGKHDNNVCFGEDKEYEDVGGFSVLKTQAPLYRQIWLKYGHIPSTKVMPISMYPILVMVVKDLMNCISDMHQCHYVELSSKMIEHWEEKIIMAETNKFNVGWLRERLEIVKKGMGGMQNAKTELLEHGQPLRATKEKMKILRDAMKRIEVQMIEAKANVRENTCGLLSESDMEMYLDIGEDLLLDGLF